MNQRTYPAAQPYCNEARPPIALLPVHPDRSRQVNAHGYDADTRTLAVQFRYGEGAIYHYPNVAAELYDEFVAAESMGIFHSKHIKDLPFKKYRGEIEAQTRGRPVEAPHGA